MMPTLDEIPATEDPVHLLLVADSKMGKSVYAAEAALAGFNMVYIDSDNGISALRYALKDKPEVMKHVHYLATSRPVEFIKNFLRSTSAKPLWWLKDRNQLWSHMLSKIEDDEIVWRIDASLIPPSWILDIDSWTSVSADALGIGSADQAAVLLEGTNQGIYGEANSNLTYICNLLQKVPYHVIVQAHGTRYEVYDKPLNTLGSQMKQAQMTLREVKDVPVSSSRPHGEVMVSRFNHIGWMSVTHLGESEIDFTRKPTRVGGGPPNRKAKTSDLSFAKLTHGVSPDVPAPGWFMSMTHAEAKKMVTGK